ncbi:MAG: nuclease-related domain-containing protein [Anaerofustis sp.]
MIIIVNIAKSVSSRKHRDLHQPRYPSQPWIPETPERIVGRIGEQRAADMIRSVLRQDDRMFTNVRISFENKPAELDNVVVNKYGVFIIEVKNYNGWLSGNEDDYEWIKTHTTDADNTYSKKVKNPIKQVKRQVYVLAMYLDYYAISVWVDGYAILLNGNSPVVSEYILSGRSDIDRVIHTPGRNRLTRQDIEQITKVLS